MGSILPTAAPLPQAFVRPAAAPPTKAVQTAPRPTHAVEAVLPAPAYGHNPPPMALVQRLQRDYRGVCAGRLHPYCASFLDYAKTPRSAGVLLVLHGFTAGPWQYYNASPRFAAAGLDVYAPRLPGHGVLDRSQPDPRWLPDTDTSHVYRDFADAVLAEARALAKQRGVPLYVMGYSLGGAIALDIATRHSQQVSRLMLIAPLMKARPLHARLLYQLMWLGKKTQRGAETLRRIMFRWSREPPTAASLNLPAGLEFMRRGPLPGYWQFPISKLFSCVHYGNKVRKRAGVLPMPVQLVVSDKDMECDPKAAQKLVARCRHQARYVFKPEHNVTHISLSERFLTEPHDVTQIAENFFAGGVMRDNVAPLLVPPPPPPARLSRPNPKRRA